VESTYESASAARVRLEVGIGVGVAVGGTVAVAVAVSVGVGVSVPGIGVSVGVFVGVLVGIGVTVGVSVGTGVKVGVLVGVAVGALVLNVMISFGRCVEDEDSREVKVAPSVVCGTRLNVYVPFPPTRAVTSKSTVVFTVSAPLVATALPNRAGRELQTTLVSFQLLSAP
jgi:hypothetical protein